MGSEDQIRQLPRIRIRGLGVIFALSKPKDQVELTWSRVSLIFGDGTGFDFRF
jgi:hypothetical protein